MIEDKTRQTKPSYRFHGNLPPALGRLQVLPQWLTWDYVWDEKKTKWQKPPRECYEGNRASGTDPRNWGSYKQALMTVNRMGLAGVGFALSADDGLTGIDLDNCRDPETGQLSDLAADIISLDETYAEVSPSGCGIRLFALGKVERAWKNDALGIEIYGQGRYLTVTGEQVPGSADAVAEAPETLQRLIALVEAERQKAKGEQRASAGPAARPPARSAANDGEGFFWAVNSLALTQLDSWVPWLFPRAKRHATGAWRVGSAELGRNLEEDLSIHPDGIQDFGLEKACTAIDLLIEHGGAPDAKAAAIVLCGRLGQTPESLGWRGEGRGGPPRDIPDPEAPDGAGPASGGNAADHDAGGSKTPDDIDLEKAGECKDMRANDTGNAERLIVWHGENIRYVVGLGWQIWTENQWERDDGSLQIRLKAQDISKRIELEPALLNASEAKLKILSQAEEAKQKDEQDRSPRDEEVLREAAEIKKDLGKVKGARWKFAISSGNNSRTEAMIRQAAPMARFDGNRLDENLMLFNVGNGTLEFSRAEDPESDPDSPCSIGSVRLRPHAREDYITRLADVDYDADAECPKFMKFLERAQPDPERRKFLQVITGYANLLGGNRAQKVIYHYGQGANGKSVFIEATSRPLGNYRATVAPETFAGEANRDSSKASSDIARLHSTWVATVEELPRGVPLKENLIKSLTGGGNLTARFLHRETFEFQPKFTPVLSGNDMPEISGNDHGIWRRLLLVPWDVTIPDEDQIDFEEMLDGFKAEWPGILNWMVKGALAYLSHGIQPYVPGDIAERTGDYRDERDPVRMFASACVDPCPENTISAKRMLAAWNHWCESNGITPWKQRGLGTRLRTLGYRKKQGSDGCFHYLDVRLTVHGMTPDDPVN
jgi:putative DNA primase/helicase